MPLSASELNEVTAIENEIADPHRFHDRGIRWQTPEEIYNKSECGKAYGLAKRYLGTIKRDDPHHQNILSLSLHHVNHPEGWRALSAQDNFHVMGLLSLRKRKTVEDIQFARSSGNAVLTGASMVPPLRSAVGIARVAISSGENDSGTLETEDLGRFNPAIFNTLSGLNTFQSMLRHEKITLSLEATQFAYGKFMAAQIINREQEQQMLRQELQTLARRRGPENASVEINQYIMANTGNLLQAWTTQSSLRGFENESNIVSLHQEVETLQRQNAHPSKILEKSQQLKDAKVKVLWQREKFDAMIDNCNHALSGAASLAAIAGNPNLAKKIEVIGGSATKIGSLVAGLCGYGSLAAGVNPVAAVSMVLGCIADLCKLGQSQDPNEQLSRQIEALAQQLQTLSKEMHERFEEVLDRLDAQTKQQFQHFFNLRSGQEAITTQLAAMEQKSTRNQETLLSVTQQSDDRVKTMIEEGHLREKNAALLAIREATSRAVLLRQRASGDGIKAYEEASSIILNFIKTPGIGSTHPDLIGPALTPEEIEKLDACLLSVPPQFYMQTLVSVYEKLGMNTETPPSTAEMHALLTKIFGENSPYRVLKNVITLNELITTQPHDRRFLIQNLAHQVDEVYEDKKEDCQGIIIPLYINARWSLVVMNGKRDQVDFYTYAIDNDVQEKVIQQLVKGGVSRDAIQVHYLPGDLRTNHIWLTEACKKINTTRNPRSLVNDLRTLRIRDSMMMHDPAFALARHRDVKNPFIVHYLSLKLLVLTYTHYKDFDNRPQIDAAELNDIKELLRMSEESYHWFSRFSDTRLFEKLTSEYARIRDVMTTLLKEDALAYQKVITNELNNAAINSVKAHLSGNLVREFLEEKINVNCYGNWYLQEKVEQWNKKSKYNEVYVEYGSDYGHRAIFQAEQAKAIYQFKHSYIEDHQLYITNIALNNAFSPFAEPVVTSIFAPVLLKPMQADKGWPLLPISDYFDGYIRDDLKVLLAKAQAQGLGTLDCVYEIVGLQFVVHLNFIMSEGTVLNLAQIKAPYDPLFYAGNEAIWWYWVGGKFPKTLNASDEMVLKNDGTYNEAHNQFIRKGYAPAVTDNQGLSEKPGGFQQSPLSPVTLARTVNTIGIALANKQNALLTRYYLELHAKFSMESQRSPLGYNLKKYNVYYKLLRMYSELLFPNSLQSGNSSICAFFKEINYIKDKHSAFDFLARILPNPFDSYLMPVTKIDDFKKDINVLIRGTGGFVRLPDVDLMQRLLMDCLNDMAPHLTKQQNPSEREAHLKAMETTLDSLSKDVISHARRSNSDRLFDLSSKIIDARRALSESVRQNTEVPEWVIAVGDQVRRLDFVRPADVTALLQFVPSRLLHAPTRSPQGFFPAIASAAANQASSGAAAAPIVRGGR